MINELELFFNLLITVLITLYFTKIVIYKIIILTTRKMLNNNTKEYSNHKFTVDVIVPIHNEEHVITKTLNSLLESSYPIHILLVDDGSTDNTVKVLTPYLKKYNNIKLLTQKNAGKSTALNKAIANSQNEILVCIDADTIIPPNTIGHLVKHFSNNKVAAVSGNLRVINLTNWLTIIQDIEYISISNYEREIFEKINGIVILPGAIGAFRRSVMVELGGYSTNHITEDLDIVVRLKEKQFIILNSKESEGYTEAPQTLNMYLRQRVRWRIGIIQVTFNYLMKKVGNWYFYVITIPYMLVFRILLPFITPLIDYYILYAILHGFSPLNIKLYACYILIDSAICMQILYKKRYTKYVMAVPLQRFCLRQLGLLVNADMIYRLLRGELFKWRRCERYGT